MVKLVDPQVVPLAKALREISKASYADEDMMREAVRRKGEFNFIDPNSGLKVDFWVTKEESSEPPEFKNRKSEKIGGQEVYFISPEDLILSKLQWCQQSQSDRHLKDAESVFKISGKKLDMKYLEYWAEKLKISNLLSKLTKS